MAYASKKGEMSEIGSLVMGASWLTIRRPVLLTEASTQCASHGCSVRRSITWNRGWGQGGR